MKYSKFPLPSIRAILALRSMFALCSAAVLMLTSTLQAATTTLNRGDNTAPSLLNGDIVIIPSDTTGSTPALLTGGISISSGRSVTFRTDTPGQWATMQFDTAAAGSRLITLNVNSTQTYTLDTVIIGGNANASNAASGGIGTSGGSALVNYIITGNFKVMNNTYNSHGGGMANSTSNVEFTGVVIFDGNKCGATSATTVNGGGFFLSGNSSQSPAGSAATKGTFDSDVTFNNNIAGGNGGGMYQATSSAEYKGNAIFTNNKAGYNWWVASPGFVAGSNGGGLGLSTPSNAQTSAYATFYQSATFLNNQAGGNGGGLWSGTNDTIEFRGNVTFTGNSAGMNTTTTYNGGGINIGTGGTLAFTAASPVTLTFNNNTVSTGGGGGIFSAANGLTIASPGSTLIMTGNVANGAGTGGGAIRANDLTLNTTFLFKNNQAASDGGAIQVYTPLAGSNILTIQGSGTFDSNLSKGAGGAIATGTALQNNMLIQASTGNIVFSNNVSGTNGGAIQAKGATSTVTLNASAGDIIFTGNRSNVSFLNGTPNLTTIAAGNGGYMTADMTSGTANDIQLQNDGMTLVLTATTGRNILFYGGISGGGATTTITKNGDGTLAFDGLAAAGANTNTVTANTTVTAGDFKLTRGAIFGASNAAGSFTLNSTGTLSGHGTVQANTITVASNSTIEALGGGLLKLNATTVSIGTGLTLIGSGTINAGVNLSAAKINVGTLTPDNPAAAPLANAAATLSVAPGAALNIENNGTVQLDLFGGTSSDKLITDSLTFAGGSSGVANINLAGTSGTYAVIQSNNTTFALTNFNITVNGVSPTARYNATGQVNSINAGVGSELDIIFGVKSLVTTWAGTPGSTWKNDPTGNGNWNDGGAITEKYFMNGDSVIFNDTASVKNVTIDAAGVIVSSMTVANTSGTYTFTGTGGITSNTTSILAGSTFAPSGKLTKTGAGTLDFQNTGANNFTAGIDLQGGVLSFSNTAQIGDGGNGITFANSATLRPNANNLTFSNKINIAAATTAAAIDIATSNTATYAGAINGTAGTLSKTGAGTLLLTTDNTAYTGTVATAAGTLLLNAGKLSNVTIANGATFGGVGMATNVTTAAGSSLQVGTPDTATSLTIGTLNLAAGSILNYSIFTGNQSSSLLTTSITGPGILALSSTLNVSSWLSGTYNLGNGTALSGAGVILNSAPLNVRQNYTLTGVGSILQLVIAPTANGILVWDGTSSGVNGAWDTTSNNWFSATAPTTRYAFTAYDSIIFDDRVVSSTYRTIDIPIPYTASAMAVGGTGAYAFTGIGGVTTDTTGVYGIVADGKLTKTGPGTLTFQNTGGNLFTAGIVIGATGTTGGVIEFTAPAQLTVGGSAAIAFQNTGTLRALSPTGTLAAPIAIANTVAATIDTGTNALTYSGSLTTLGATGTFVKIGTGTLTFARINSSAAGLATNIAAGTLLLNSSTLSGPVTLSGSTTLGGYGAITNTTGVNATAGSSIQVGLGRPGGVGTLTIAKLTLAGSNTLTGSGTLAGAAVLNGLVTTAVNAGDNLTLSGTNTGSGSILKTGSGNLIYTNASALAYTGSTQINQGYVMLRGITGTAASTVANTIVLNGGWLDLSDSAFDSTGSTANNWNSLKLVQGANASAGGVIGSNDAITLGAGDVAYNIGSIVGTSTKTGVFVVINAGNSTATLTGTNLYMGYTRIDSGTLKVTANAQLGSTTASREVILNGGALEVSGTGFATTRTIILRADSTIQTDAGVLATWNGGIDNTGTWRYTLTKVGSGTLSVGSPSNGDGNNAAVTNINEGRYIATDGPAAGNAISIANVAANATLEYRTTGNAIAANAITGSGTLNIAVTSGSLTFSNANLAIANIAMANSTVVFNSGTFNQTIGTSNGAIRIDNSRAIVATANSTFGNITLANNATFGFTLSGTTPLWKVATVTSLSGGGNLALNTNLALGLADRINITTGVSGSYNLAITNTGAVPIAAATPVTLITAPATTGSAATFTTRGGKVQAGMFSYDLVTTTNAAAGTTVQLVTTGALSNTGQLIYELAGTQTLSWFSELESVSQRMGDLHFAANAADAVAGAPGKNSLSTWIRGYGQRINYGKEVTGTAFDEQQIGASVGADYRIGGGDKAALYIGAYVGYGQTQRTYDFTGDAKAKSTYAGLYATLVTVKGWYIDGVLKDNRFKNSFDASMNTGAFTGADYNQDAYGASIEVGKYNDIGNGWFLEPQAQATYTKLGSANYTTTNDLNVSLHQADTEQVRAGLRAGRTFKTGFGEYFQVYAKAYLAKQWTTGGRIYVDGQRSRPTPKIEGNRAEGGAGIAWLPNNHMQIFFDYEASHSTDYDKPWGVNGGIRYSW